MIRLVIKGTIAICRWLRRIDSVDHAHTWTLRIAQYQKMLATYPVAAPDLVEVVAEHVTLTLHGKTLFGLCPFHSEKTPSFMVHHNRRQFYCFGCGEHGDVFTFMNKIAMLK